MESKLNFGQALEAVKEGKLIAREGWNGKDMFVFQRPADTLDATFIQNVKSLPQKVKDYFSLGQVRVKFTAYLCMKNAQGEIMNGWAATQTDMLAEDWTILD